MKRKIEIEVDVPDGLEPTGEFVNDLRPNGEPALLGRLILRRVEPKRESRWVNMYRCDNHDELIIHMSRERADACAATHRKTVLRIDYENGKPVGVTLEPTEGDA